MTIFAGAFVLDPTTGDVPEEVRTQLHAAVSRHAEPRTEVRKPGFYCVKIDIAALVEPGFLEDAEGASILAGEPLVGSDHAYPPRNKDLAIIHEHLLRGKPAILSRTHGTFALAHYRQETRSLVLTVDKLGIRCLYYWCDGSIVVFATARRILQAIDRVPKILDERGALEAIAFGTPLQRRTEFERIICLDAGEAIHFDEDGEERSRYYRWDLPPATSTDDAFDVGRVHSAFTRAVSRRLRPEESAVLCFLSGGLDSRCIASALKMGGREVHTLNFSRPGSYDQVISEDFSKQLGTIHSAKVGPIRPISHRQGIVGYNLRPNPIRLRLSSATSRAASPEPARVAAAPPAREGCGV